MNKEGGKGSNMSDFGGDAAGWQLGGFALVVVGTGVGFGQPVGPAEHHPAPALYSKQSHSACAAVAFGLVLLRGLGV